MCFAFWSKTDAEHLFHLKEFEDWMLQTGFCHLYCHWSQRDDGANAFGNEGIILFSKVKCDVTYGIGHHEMDAQARALTAEFSDCIFLFTYNPQGGFSKESLNFRAEWESKFGSYLEKTVQDAKSKGKKLIWAGDLNVNPSAKDWSEQAFVRIKHKMPRDTVMAGCRECDQKVYRELVTKMDGCNVAEHFKKQGRRTCFPTERCLKMNEGQRIDHIIAEKSLFAEESKLRLTAFDAQFGGSRKGSSDHCPLWCKLERGEKQVLTHRASPENDEKQLEADILKELSV